MPRDPIEFRIGGRKVSAGNVGRELTKELRKQTDDAIEDWRRDIDRKLRALRCPKHHHGLTNIRTNNTSSGFSWQFDACCETLRVRAEALLR